MYSQLSGPDESCCPAHLCIASILCFEQINDDDDDDE